MYTQTNCYMLIFSKPSWWCWWWSRHFGNIFICWNETKDGKNNYPYYYTQCYCQKWPLLWHSAGLITKTSTSDFFLQLLFSISYLSLCNSRLPLSHNQKCPPIEVMSSFRKKYCPWERNLHFIRRKEDNLL